MSLNIWNLEWLNHNSQRSYPIADWADRKCNLSDDIILPNDFILALSLTVNSSHNIEINKFYIKAIAVMGSCCSITIGYAEDEQDVADITIYTKSIQDTYAFTGIGNFDDVKGYIGINRSSLIFESLSGYFTFNYESTAIEPDCIRNTSKMLSAIQIDNGRSKSERLYGPRTLYSGNNINITAETNDDTTTITFNGIDDNIKKELNGSIEDDEECMPNFAKKPPILSINGVTPDKDGNIEIEGLNSATIKKTGNGIKIEDAFAEPCCECEELDALYDKLNALISQYRPIKALADDIDTRQQILDEGGNSCSFGNTCNCVGTPPPEEDGDEEEGEQQQAITQEDIISVYYIKVAYRDLINAPANISPFADPFAGADTHNFTRETDNGELIIKDQTFTIDAFTVDTSIGLFDNREQVYDGYRRLVIPWPSNAPAVESNDSGGFYNADTMRLPGVKFKAYWHYRYPADPREIDYIQNNNGTIPSGGSKLFDVYRMGLTEYNQKYASDEWQVRYK